MFRGNGKYIRTSLFFTHLGMEFGALVMNVSQLCELIRILLQRSEAGYLENSSFFSLFTNLISLWSQRILKTISLFTFAIFPFQIHLQFIMDRIRSGSFVIQIANFHIMYILFKFDMAFVLYKSSSMSL